MRWRLFRPGSWVSPLCRIANGGRNSGWRVTLGLVLVAAAVTLFATAGLASTSHRSHSRGGTDARARRTVDGRPRSPVRHLAAVRHALVSGSITTDGTPTSLTISTLGDTASVTFSEAARPLHLFGFQRPLLLLQQGDHL
jgi:hypothetical protein